MLEKFKAWALGSFNYNLKRSAASGGLTLPVINNVGRAHLDKHDPHLAVLLERLYSPGTLLIDVGVNIGQTLVKYARIAGPSCRYIGFEPNIKAAGYVDEIIIRNAMQNALVVPIALGSDTRLATLSMAHAGSTDPGASINGQIRDAKFYGAQTVIAVFKGDDALDKLGPLEGPAILKIDVEGAEFEVLMGLERTIAELRPFVILEILPVSDFSTTVNEYRLGQAKLIKSHMTKRDYVTYAIGEDGELGLGISPTCDYLFVPSEKAARLGSGLAS